MMPFAQIKMRYKDILWLSFAPFTLFLQIHKINGQDVFEILRPLRLVLLVIVVGTLAFTIVPQGQHVMMSLATFSGNFVQLFFVFLSLIYWSYQLYYCSRMLLKLTNVRYDLGKEVRLYVYMNNIPIIFATFPFYIFQVAYISVNGIYTVGDWVFILALLLVNIVLTTFFFSKTAAENLCEKHSNWHTRYFKIKIQKELSHGQFSENMTWWFRFLIVTFVVLFSLFTYWSIEGIHVLQFIGSTAIIITGLSAWVAVATVVAVINNRIYRYASLLLFGLLIFCSYFNNNHAIRTLDEPINNRLDVATHYKNWKQKRQKENLKAKNYPVFIVAIEGGGSRSAYWSGSLLAALCDTLPELSNHIFAISSVSGGSLSSGVFTLMQKAQAAEGKKFKQLPYMQAALGQDFLSPITASLIFPDFSQHFFPFKIQAFDRAKALEYSWEHAYSHAFADNVTDYTLKSNIYKLWENDSLYKVPSLFLNCAAVNTGKRAIISNLELKTSSFDDVIALSDTIGKGIPLSTAISLSSRFPYITPSGLVEKKDGTQWGSVVDGGYFDNSGILTALEIIEIINKSNAETKNKTKFEPYLVIISNYSDYTDNSHFNEINEPVRAIINRTFGGSIGYARARVKREMPPNTIIELSLNATSKEVPLGWYLSKSAKSVMDERLKNSLKNNYAVFSQLITK